MNAGTRQKLDQMKTIQNGCIGIDQGDVSLFSDFEDGGEMWTGEGPRERRQTVEFDQPFRQIPSVHLSISLWDVDTNASMRAELVAENITETQFDIVFRTWMDSRIARIRVAYMAIGPVPHWDDWDIP